MTGRTKIPAFTGGRQEIFLPAIYTPNPRKTRRKIATVQVLIDYLTNHRTIISILVFKLLRIYPDKLFKILRKKLIKSCLGCRCLYTPLIGFPHTALKGSFQSGEDKLQGIDFKLSAETQLHYAQEIGLGSRRYELEEV